MEGIHVINSSPIDNSFCRKMSQAKGNVVCKYCYSIKTTIPNSPNNIRCQNAWKRIGDLLSSRILDYNELPFSKNRDKIFPYVRLSSHEELINGTHYLNLLNIVEKNPLTIFVLWTKRLDIIKKFGRHDLSNLILLFSQPSFNVIDPKIPIPFDKTFSVYTIQFATENDIKINCHISKNAKCINCLKCFQLNNVSHINELLKGSPLNWRDITILLVDLLRSNNLDSIKPLLDQIDEELLLNNIDLGLRHQVDITRYLK